MIDKINIRVYAIYLNEKNELIALDEGYAGEKLVKLPGGGLEFGEGTIECLHREFAEELNLKIEVLEHFYTQEDFLVSRFRENEQLLTIYYTVNILNLEDFLASFISSSSGSINAPGRIAKSIRPTDLTFIFSATANIP